MKRIFIIVVNGKEYHFTSKKEADKFFIDAFLNGGSVHEIKLSI